MSIFLFLSENFMQQEKQLDFEIFRDYLMQLYEHFH